MSDEKRVSAPRPPFDPIPPLKVYYPFGGRRFLLNWYTDYDRGHLVVAGSEAALQVVFRSILDDVPNILQVCEVEIVAPPQRLCIEAAKRAYEEEVESFMNQVTWRLRDALSFYGKLSLPFLPCDKYESEDGEEDSSRPLDAHYGCKNCSDGIRLVGVTREELHERYGDRWRDTFGDFRHREPDKKLVMSQARQANGDESVRTAVGDYGHHQRGVHLREQEFSNYPVLFYFVHVRDIDSGSYVAEIEALREARKLKQEQEEKARIDEVSSESNENAYKVRRFFRLAMANVNIDQFEGEKK